MRDSHKEVHDSAWEGEDRCGGIDQLTEKLEIVK